MTADAPYVAEVAEAMARRYYGSTAFDQFSDGGKAEALSSCWADATVAVETLTPLIRAQVAAEIGRKIDPHAPPGSISAWRNNAFRTAARIAEATP